jgi:Tol biopolymer transport system component
MLTDMIALFEKFKYCFPEVNKLTGTYICLCFVLFWQCKKEETITYSWPEGLPGKFIFDEYRSAIGQGYGLIFTYDSNGLKQLTQGSHYFLPRWSPDGSEFICITDTTYFPAPFSQISGDITIVRSDGSDPVFIRVKTSHARLSADGTKIIYIKFMSNYSTEIRVMDRSGSDDHLLTPLSESFSDLSRDMNHILTNWDDNIYLINLAENSKTQLTDSGQNYGGVFSTDGNKIAYTHKDSWDSAQNIYLMNTDGTGKTNVTNYTSSNYGWAYSPTWSSDGTMMAFGLMNEEWNYVLHVINSDGSGLIRIEDEGHLGGWDWIDP